MVVHSGKYAVSIRVHSAKSQMLGVIPFLNCSLDAVEIRQFGQTVVLSPKAATANSDYPQFVALCADKSFTLSSRLGEAPVETADTLKLSDRAVVAYAASREPVKDFTVTMAFGFTAEAAARKAEELAAADPINAELQACYDYLTKSLLWTDDGV